MIDIIANSKYDDSLQLICLFSKDKPDTKIFIDYFKKETLLTLCMNESECQLIEKYEYLYQEFYNITITQVRTWM
jgi:hypothetical protein